MGVGKQWQSGREQEHAMQESQQRAKPPGRHPNARKEQEVQHREAPAADRVDQEADDRRPISIRREERSDQERQAQARQAEALAALEDRRHRDRRYQAPQQKLWQVSRKQLGNVHCFSSASAALITPTWV